MIKWCLWHRWYIVKSEGRTKLYDMALAELTGEKWRVLSDYCYDREVHRKVCLKCGTVKDDIKPEYKKAMVRAKKVVKIMDRVEELTGDKQYGVSRVQRIKKKLERKDNE